MSHTAPFCTVLRCVESSWLTAGRGNPSRNYAEAKLQENLDSEIMEVLLQEAHEAFDEEIVIELTSNTADEMETNADRIEAWVRQWKTDNNAARDE